jgi:hypothetical protein
MTPAVRSFRLGAIAVALMLLSSCFNPFHPRVAVNRGISQPPPLPDSPVNALLLFEWCWEHRSITEYEQLFTDDFRFAFASTDSSGNAYLERGFAREDELESARHLFLGGDASQPAASRIVLDFDPNLVALPDNRPGKLPPWHQEIDTRITLSIDFSSSGERVNGSARFFLVRGDSAVIPRELQDRGFGPDPHRWYIERYEEEDPGNGAASGASSASRAWRGFPAAARPAAAPADARASDGLAPASAAALPDPCGTWGCVKARYR